MSETVADIGVRVGANIMPLTQGMSRAGKSVESFSSRAGRDLKKATKAIAAVGAAAAMAGAAILAGMWKNGGAAIDAQAKLAAQLNTTSESLAVLTRAGDLTGAAIEKIGAASRALDVALGKAAQGGNAQADSLDRMGLSAAKLAALPLDQRILALNEAIKANIPAVERAAVAAELFGAKNGAAIKSLDAESMAQARKETVLFGLALSEIDSAKVESANDSFAVIKMAMTGLTQQMAIQMAPIIDLVGQKFLSAAEEAGGFGNKVETIFDKTVRGAIAAARSVRPAILGITSALDSIWIGFKTLPAWVQEAGLIGAIIGGKTGGRVILAALATTSVIAGRTATIKKYNEAVAEGLTPDIGPISGSEAERVINELQLKLDKMAGTSIFGSNSQQESDAWASDLIAQYERVKQKATESARIVAEGRAGLGGGGDDPEGDGGEDGQREIDAELEKTRALLQVLSDRFASEGEMLSRKLVSEDALLSFGFENSMMSMKQHGELVLALKQEQLEAETAIESRRFEQAMTTLSEHLEAGMLTEEEYNLRKLSAQQAHDEALAAMSAANYEFDAEFLKERLDNKLLTEEEYNLLIEIEAQRHVDAMLAISIGQATRERQQQSKDAADKLGGRQQMFDDLTTLMNSSSKKMFKIGKAAAMAQMAIDGWEAASSAWKIGMKTGPWTAVAYTAASLAKTGSMMSSIRSQSFGGGGSGARATGSNTTAINAAATPVQSQQSQSNRGNISISLVGDTFSAESVRKLIGQISEQLGDGVMLRGS